MLLKPLFRQLFKPLAVSLSSAAAVVARWIYSFDGVDDRGQLQFRAINPDGDIDAEWSQTALPAGIHQHVINQNVSGGNTTREFTSYINPTTKKLEVILGGVLVRDDISATDYTTAGRYRILIQGSTWTFFKNGVAVMQKTQVRGTAREPSAVTLIGCRADGAGFSDFFRAAIYDVRINGTFYPIGERNQPIQLPQPSGLGSEIVANSGLAGATSTTLPSWTRANNAVFSYSGGLKIEVSTAQDASIQQTLTTVAGQQYLVEIVTGSFGTTVEGRLSLNNGAPAWAGNVAVQTFRASTTFRVVFTATGPTTGLAIFANSVINGAFITLMSVSVRPLWVVSPTERLINGDFSGGTAGWNFIAVSNFSVVSGQATLQCSAGNANTQRIEREVTGLDVGAYYLYTADLVSATGCNARINILKSDDASYRGLGGQTVPAGSSNVRMRHIFIAPADRVLVQLSNDAGPAAGTLVFDNASVRKLDSICNPLTLVNTTSPGWQLFDPNAPLPSFNFSLQNNSQYLPFI